MRDQCLRWALGLWAEATDDKARRETRAADVGRCMSRRRRRVICERAVKEEGGGGEES